MIWLIGQLAPDFKTIADFRKDNGKAIREVWTIRWKLNRNAQFGPKENSR